MVDKGTRTSSTPRGAPPFLIAPGTPPPSQLLGAFAPRNGSRLSRADALGTFPWLSGPHPRSLGPQALSSHVSRTERRSVASHERHRARMTRASISSPSNNRGVALNPKPSALGSRSVSPPELRAIDSDPPSHPPAACLP